MYTELPTRLAECAPRGVGQPGTALLVGTWFPRGVKSHCASTGSDQVMVRESNTHVSLKRLVLE
jgi:hypothetical protein